MRTAKYLAGVSISVWAIIFLTAGGCTTQKNGSNYNLASENAALVFDLKLSGLNPHDRLLLKEKFMGQSRGKLLAELELAQKRAPQNVLVKWTQQAERIEIRISTQLADEISAYEVSVFLNKNDMIQDLYWNTASYPK